MIATRALTCSHDIGGLAAGIQSGIGPIAAGSLFATAQSVAMGGAIPTVFSVMGAGVGAAVGSQAMAQGDGNENDRDESDGGGSDGSGCEGNGNGSDGNGCEGDK